MPDEVYIIGTMKRIPQRGWPDVFEINRATRSVLWCAGTRMVIESEQQ